MNKLLYILLFLSASSVLFAQKEQDGCFEDRIYRYSVDGAEGMLFHWQLTGGKIVNNDIYNDTISIVWANEGKHKLSVYGELDGCLTDVQEIIINLRLKPEFSFEKKDIQICKGESYTFRPFNSKSDDVKSIKWNSMLYSDTFTVSTTQKVWSEIYYNFGCKAIDTATVLVRDIPNINLGTDTMLCGDQKLVLNALNAIYDGAIYEWSTLMPSAKFYSNEPSIEVSKGEAKYSLKVTDVYGCEAYDTVTIRKCSDVFSKENISIAFTPNGDGDNDIWNIIGLAEEFPDAIVDVYDRGGRLVYRSDKGYGKPWDGKERSTNKVLPMASYFYIIHLNNKAGDKVPGTLNIIR